MAASLPIPESAITTQLGTRIWPDRGSWAQEVKWVGKHTHGLSWCRGTHIWPTPNTGVRIVIPAHSPALHPHTGKPIANYHFNRNLLATGVYHGNLSCCDNDSRHCDSPSTAYTQAGDPAYGCEYVAEERVVESLRKVLQEANPEDYEMFPERLVDPARLNIPRGCSYFIEDGDSSFRENHVVLQVVRDLPALQAELAEVQRVGEEHGHKFMWV